MTKTSRLQTSGTQTQQCIKAQTDFIRYIKIFIDVNQIENLMKKIILKMIQITKLLKFKYIENDINNLFVKIQN